MNSDNDSIKPSPKWMTSGRFLADLGGRVASFCVAAYLDFKEYIGLGRQLEGTESISALNTVSGIDERIFQFLEIPFRRIYLGNAEGFSDRKGGDGSFFDEWGVKYIRSGFYNERVFHPLANAECIDDILGYSWPNPSDEGRTSGLKQRIQEISANSEVILAAGHISAGIFQDCWNLRGMQKFFEDMVINREFAEALIEKITDIHIGLWNTFLSVVGNYVDIVETADDLGSQKGLLISPVMYRKLIKPYHQKLNMAIRKKTNAKILYHSCGAIMPLIEDLIEIGVDILNPIQPLNGLMEPCELARKFSNRIIFHGGLDVQNLLLNGTEEEIKIHVKKYYANLGTDGYIMAPTNTIQPGTPPANILAAYHVIKEISV